MLKNLSWDILPDDTCEGKCKSSDSQNGTYLFSTQTAHLPKPQPREWKTSPVLSAISCQQTRNILAGY
jgi:hypothetical protein